MSPQWKHFACAAGAPPDAVSGPELFVTAPAAMFKTSLNRNFNYELSLARVGVKKLPVFCQWVNIFWLVAEWRIQLKDWNAGFTLRKTAPCRFEGRRITC